MNRNELITKPLIVFFFLSSPTPSYNASPHNQHVTCHFDQQFLGGHDAIIKVLGPVFFYSHYGVTHFCIIKSQFMFQKCNHSWHLFLNLAFRAKKKPYKNTTLNVNITRCCDPLRTCSQQTFVSGQDSINIQFLNYSKNLYLSISLQHF